MKGQQEIVIRQKHYRHIPEKWEMLDGVIDAIFMWPGSRDVKKPSSL